MEGGAAPSDFVPTRDAAPLQSALDRLLARALAHVRERDPGAARDRWRGLHLDIDAMQALLASGDLLAGFEGEAATLADAARQNRAFALLADLYGLDDLALAVVALAAAAEIDARYGRLFAFLQDDVTRRRPSPALALDLFCASAAQRAAARGTFASGARLRAEHIIELEPVSGETGLTGALRLDPQILQLVLGEPGIDPRLSACCTLRAGRIAIANLPVEPTIAATLRHAAASLRAPIATPLRLMLSGPPGCGQDEAVDALAAAAELPLLTLDARALAAEPGEARMLLAIFRREALLANAVAQIIHADALDGETHAYLRSLLQDELPRLAPAVVLASAPGTWLAAAGDRVGFAPLVFELPSSELRGRIWRDRTAEQGLSLSSPDLDMLAARFRLTPLQIAQATARAAMMLRCQSDIDEPASALRACFAAAPSQGGHDLARLSKRIAPRFTWADIVTTGIVGTQLKEICERVRLGATVLERWRFADKLALGRGVTALFAGPSGTGKTMAAEVIANTLGIDLFKIDLAAVVSKYIGETEQNLDRIFRAAEDVNGILLFDEADALFGKRSEVRDSHDRYANLEISYLLQKMEEFDGVAILSTNLQKNLDDAFTRRLSFIVYFPFPDAADRKRIWEVVWPDAVPRERTLCFDAIAEICKLSGGNIKSAALGGAYYAAAEGTAVGIRHVVRAVEREYEKLGRPLKPQEVAPLLATQQDAE
jgi:ATP-dependent 26S proteasome regulatory subunit